MNLQTKIPLLKQSKNQIDHNSNLLLLGSCFTNNIGKKMDYFKFQNTQNPLGILFHPKAIETFIENSVNKREYTDKDVFFENEQWHCFDAHSKLSNTSKEDLINSLNRQITLTNKQIHNSSHIIITIGTAWVYRFIESDKIVANCHKVPQKQFQKKILFVDDIAASLKNVLSLIRSVNYETNIIFTVSPVRHIKDGFVENAQSKAHILAAIHQVINSQTYYFPSYEIMMDELRDYRFYTEDMIHPNETAINYIWEKFQQVWISDRSLVAMEEIDGIQKGLLHKPFNPNSSKHREFLQKLEAKKMKLQTQFPHIVF